MENRLTVAGFGGQGVMMIGQLLCYASVDVGKEVNIGRRYGITAMIIRDIAPRTVILLITLCRYLLVSEPGRIPGIYAPDLPRFSAT